LVGAHVTHDISDKAASYCGKMRRIEEHVTELARISVIVCSYNPRAAYLQRTLQSLAGQTLKRSDWELLLIDNNSDTTLSELWDLSWHPNGRHLREDELGLTPARLRGIAESAGRLLIFVDDDNVLAADYLERADSLAGSWPELGVFGSGTLEPEFETPPPPQVEPLLPMLALRSVPTAQCANKSTETQCIPWGAGLCVRREIATAYAALVKELSMSALGRSGERLFCGEDDVFSFLASKKGSCFGIFPELRITHLISARRLTENYFVRLVRDHAYSHTVLRYRLFGELTRRRRWIEAVRTLLHGVRRGTFSMRCRRAAIQGTDAATKAIFEQRLRPIDWSEYVAFDEQPAVRVGQ
jgi:glycosyltransferase involved in cell wall biosynthesis